MPNFLLRAWSDFAPALGNHLWQSTLFVAVVALLTLAFRQNRARTRYWLWLAASLKSFVPFSLLIKVGAYFATPHVPNPMRTVLYSAFEQVGQPFAVQRNASIAQSAPVTSRDRDGGAISATALVVWLLGSLSY